VKEVPASDNVCIWFSFIEKGLYIGGKVGYLLGECFWDSDRILRPIYGGRERALGTGRSLAMSSWLLGIASAIPPLFIFHTSLFY
jgi:hypothetical protein